MIRGNKFEDFAGCILNDSTYTSGDIRRPLWRIFNDNKYTLADFEIKKKIVFKCRWVSLKKK